MNKLSKREQVKLHSFWGQLIDLKCGNVKELVIINDDNAELLSQVIRERLAEEKEIKKAEVEDSQAEEVGSSDYPLGGLIEAYDIEREKEF